MSEDQQTNCLHLGFHSSSSSYCRERKELSFALNCEECGKEIRTVATQSYAPNFNPNGNDGYATL